MSSLFADSNLIGTDMNGKSYGMNDNDLFDHTIVIPPASDSNYWSVIEGIVDRFHIDCALVHPESEVWTWSERLEAGKAPCPVLMPPTSMVRTLVDKSIFSRLLKNTRAAPLSVEIDPIHPDWKKIEGTLNYPFWVRAVRGTSGLGSLLVHDQEEFTAWMKVNPTIEKFLASPFLSGRNLAVKLLYYKGALVRSAVGERVDYIMSKVAPSGITGNTRFGRLLNDPDTVDFAVRAMDSLFEITGTAKNGFYTVDIKEDENGLPFITEVNVRMVAFNSAFAAAGANFTEDMLRLTIGDPTFNCQYQMYEFEEGLVFLRDVDGNAKLMREHEMVQ